MNELYIKMCREAHEIQDVWKNKPENQIKGGEQLIWKKWKEPLDPGNLWILPEWDDYLDMVDPFQPCPFLLENRDDYFWFPRIEDLVGIFKKANSNPDDYWVLKSFLVWFTHLPDQCLQDMGIVHFWLRFQGYRVEYHFITDLKEVI